MTRAPAQPSGAANATVNKQTRGTITLLWITGRLTETFKGDALGRELRGTVAIDLGGVERITSFGVREWLAMLGAMQDVRRLYLLRCSEAVVNQLSMIRKFSGNGQIVSFFAPYLCGACGEQFERSFDCETEAESIRAGNAPEAPCAHCGAQGSFDDDARTYFAFAAPHLDTAVPADVRSILDELDAAAPPPSRDAVDKTVEGNVTRVRVNTKLGTSVRWKRVLDGIEGSLVIDLGGVTGVERRGHHQLRAALRISRRRGHDNQRSSDRPPALVTRFAQVGVPAGDRRLRHARRALLRMCRPPPCARLHPQHGEALAAGTLPRVNCKRCNGELALRDADAALRFLQSQHEGAKPAKKDPTAVLTPTSIANVPMSLAGVAVAPRPSVPEVKGAEPGTAKKRSRASTYAIAGLSLAVVGLVGMQVLRSQAPAAPTPPRWVRARPTALAVARRHRGRREGTTNAASPQGSSANAWMQNVDLPPAWVERPFVLDGNDVLVVGKSELSTTPEPR